MQLLYPTFAIAAIGYEINNFIVSAGAGIAFWLQKNGSHEEQEIDNIYYALKDDRPSISYTGYAFMAEVAYFLNEIKLAGVYSYIDTAAVKMHSLGFSISFALK